MNNDELVLEMRGISRGFPGVQALEDVDFAVRRGEVHALVGENGAGKSTLIKVLTGVYAPDAGSIHLDGSPISPRSPAEAQSLGISAIHQEVDLLPYLSIAENILIGRQPRKWGRIDWRETNARARRAVAALGIDVDVTHPLGSYPVAIRQMVSVARAVDMSCRVLVMDEPTSSLDEREVAQLFETMRRLKASGVSIIFITHFLDQLYSISDRITVLRNGREVGVLETAQTPKIELVARMLGRSLQDVERLLSGEAAGKPTEPGEVLLEAVGLGRGLALKPADLTVREGEVVGLAGLLGSGRTELARLLFGADRPTSGEIRISGRRADPMSPAKAIRHGIGFSPEDRRTEGIVPQLSVLENIVLAIHRRISRLGLTSRARQREIAQRYVNLLNIATPNLDQPVGNLSGGNQQKVILARWLASQPRLLILDEPTRGIDVGAKAEIEGLVESLSQQGVAIIFISSELDEVVRRCSRIAVMRDREKVAEMDRSQATTSSIMEAIAGAGEEQSREP